MKKGNCGAVHFSKVVVPILTAKMRFRPKRGIAFLPTAPIAIGVRSGDFYRVGAEIFQIVKKSFVFGHSSAE